MCLRDKVRCIGKMSVVQYLVGLSYSAFACGACGAGSILYIGRTHYFQFKLGCRRGKNTQAELLALCGVSLVAWMMGLPFIEFFCD